MSDGGELVREHCLLCAVAHEVGQLRTRQLGCLSPRQPLKFRLRQHYTSVNLRSEYNNTPAAPFYKPPTIPFPHAFPLPLLSSPFLPPALLAICLRSVWCSFFILEIILFQAHQVMMEKQKLAEMVMQKMRQKKEQEERNRPHYEVLRLEATFQHELNAQLKQSISHLEAALGQDQKRLQELQAHLNELDNTGKKSLPRIVVMPEFIASEKVSAETKDFYRKCSNSFLRSDILRSKGFEEASQQEQSMLGSLAAVRQLEAAILANSEQDRRTLNDKRVKVLKEDLRLRSIREEQRMLRRQMEEEREQNSELLHEYEVKKVNLQSRKDRLQYVTQQIEHYKAQIEAAFNPITYRDHLGSVFAIQIKNQIMQENLTAATSNVHHVDRQNKFFEKQLEKTSSLLVLGRTSDSPAAKLGKIKKRLDQERQSSSRAHSHRPALASHRSLSQNSIHKSTMALDFSTLVHSSGKASMRTTDRTSSHRKQHSSVSRSLF